MKTRIAFIVFILIAVFGGYFWHYHQPEQKIKRAVDQFIGAVEYDSTKLRSREDVHEAVRNSTRETITLKISDLSNLPFNVDLPREMSFERLCSRLDLLHAATSERDFTTLEEELQLIGNKAQLTRIAQITMASPFSGKETQSWELVFDLELEDQWKITALRASKHH